MKKQPTARYTISSLVLVLNKEKLYMIMNLDKKKRFENPELEIVEFTNDDIITNSGEFGNTGGDAGDINKPKGWW